MKTKPPRGLFITGTSTEVGKTYVAALLARTLAARWRVGVYKPVASGCHEEAGELVADDAVALWEAAGRPGTLEHVCPQRFRAPLAPHQAARQEGKQVDAARLRDGLQYWLDRSDIVLIEGAGGLMSPLTDDEYNADLAFVLGFPLLVVAPNQLGVINQTLQTLITAAAFREGLDVAGVVLNTPRSLDPEQDPSRLTNRAELEQRCGPPVLAEVGFGSDRFDREVDWFEVAQPAVERYEEED